MLEFAAFTPHHAQLTRITHSLRVQCGMVIKPKTPVEVLFPFVEKIDLVLIMTVEPGFGGQSFMEDQMAKVGEKATMYIPCVCVCVCVCVCSWCARN